MHLGNVYGPYRMYQGAYYVGINLYSNDRQLLESKVIPYKQYVREYTQGFHRYQAIETSNHPGYQQLNCAICKKPFRALPTRDNYFRSVHPVGCNDLFQRFKKYYRKHHHCETGIYIPIRSSRDSTGVTTHILHIGRNEFRGIWLIPIEHCSVTIWSDINNVGRTSLRFDKKLAREVRSVVGFKKGYWVTEDGTVISKQYQCIKCPRIDRKGYNTVVLHSQWYDKQMLVHRVVAEAFIPRVEGKPLINHKDGNKINNHWTNLEWCTYKENTTHALQTGLRNNYGENCKLSKLTNEQVRWMRKDYIPGVTTQKKYSIMFDVDASTINCALRRKTFKQVTP